MRGATRVLMLAAIAAGVFLSASPTGAASAGKGERILRFGVFIPMRTVTVRAVMKPWTDEINAALDGEVEVRLFTGGALGRSGKQQYRLLQENVLDITWILPGYIPGQFPGSELFEIPLHSSDSAAVSIAFWRMYKRGLLEGFEDIHPLSLFVSPPYHFHLSFPYDGIGALAGRKIRAVTFVQASLLEKVGATPIGGITATQVAESLSRGLLDGALFSWHATRSIGITQVAYHHVNQPITFSPAILAMNRDTYASLSPRAQAVFDEMGGERLTMRFIAAMEKFAAASRAAAMKDPERRFYNPDPAERARWRAIFAEVAAEWRSAKPGREALVEALAQTLAEIESENPVADATETGS